MNRTSSAQAQQLLAYLVVDHTGVIRKHLSLIKQQLASLESQLDSNSATRSRVQLEVVVADFADYGTAEITDPTSSQRLPSSDSVPGCDLGEALREVLNSLHKKEDEGTGENSKVEVIVLLAGEPSGNWEDGIRALAQRGAGITVVAFASEGMIRDETLKRIGPQAGRALRLDLFDVATAKNAFSWLGEFLQQSVKSMGQAPIAKPRAASSLPRAQATPRPVTVPPSPAAESSVAYLPQEALTAPEPVTASPLPVAGPSPVSSPQEARVAPVAMPPPQAPVSPEVGEAPVSAEDAVPPERGPEPPRADSQERLPEEAALDLEAKEDMQREERKAMLEESAMPAPDVSPLKEEGGAVGTVGPEQPEVAPPVEEVVDLEVEVAPAEEGAPVEAVIEPEPEPPPVTKDGIATIWEEREPTDPSDPVDHTDARMLEAPDGWRIVGASRRGKMHAHKGIYREDAFAFGEANGWHLVVVADGGGSCPLSRVGSQLAADTAVATMAHFAPMKKNDDRTIAKEDIEYLCEMALRKGAEGAWKALQKAAQERNRDMKDFGTTFLAMMHHPDEAGYIIGVLQVGDGLVAAEMANGSIKALAEPDVGETAGVTLFLTSKPWKEWVDRAVVDTLKSPLKLLTAMCDGVADDFIPFEQHLRKLFDALDNVTKHEQPEQQLLDLLAYEKRGSFDDRTLVMIYQAQDMPDRGAEAEEAEHASIPPSAASDSPAPTSPDTVEEDEGSDGDVA